jgi:hypothetical protein
MWIFTRNWKIKSYGDVEDSVPESIKPKLNGKILAQGLINKCNFFAHGCFYFFSFHKALSNI